MAPKAAAGKKGGKGGAAGDEKREDILQAVVRPRCPAGYMLVLTGE